MKNITQLKGKLSKKEILATEEAHEVKGGQRFITKSYFVALIKNYTLKSHGHATSLVQHNGEYCIEW